MNKPRFIEAQYTQVLQYDLEDLDIDWEDVVDYDVKWTTLSIEFKNGEVIEVNSYHECDTDWKWANKVQAFDENFYEVELPETEDENLD
jgi:coenzyme F420-reducing hydrogenase beta subunit